MYVALPLQLCASLGFYDGTSLSVMASASVQLEASTLKIGGLDRRRGKHPMGAHHQVGCNDQRDPLSPLLGMSSLEALAQALLSSCQR